MNQVGAIHFIKNESGTQLALTYTPANQSNLTSGPGQDKGPVLLAHGTFSNHRSLRGLSQHLSDNGYDCWVLDFQGHGHSDEPLSPPRFDSMCIEDAAAAITHLKTLYPTQKIIWIGHSGGGLAVLSLLARRPSFIPSLKAIVTVASQTTHAAKRRKNRIIILLSSVITRLLGFAPGKIFKLGPENEFGPVMTQWYQWSLSQKWLAADGFDYLQALNTISTPTLMLSGTGDTFIAPPGGCRALFDRIGSNDKDYQECGLSTGYAEDYNHSRIITSVSASKEIWPLISTWLNRYC